MAHHEREITITVSIDPDLTRHVKKSNVPHEDMLTRETIPAGSPCYSLGIRFDGGRKLYRGYVSVETYQRMQEEVQA